MTTVLGQGEPLGRGRALARSLEVVLVGTARGRVAPGTPRSGLGPFVEAELAALRLPGPENPESREVRLDPLRSDLDGRREILLQRLAVCGVGYGEPVEVTGTGDGTALTTRWRLSWTPAVPARLDLAGVRGVTSALAAAGTLRETFRRQAADGGATCAQILGGLRAAARCDLPALVADRLADAAAVLPSAATLPELLEALDLLEALRRGHLPGTAPDGRRQAAELAATLLEAAVRALPGLAGSDQPDDAAALIALSARAGEHRLGLRLDDALGTLARTGSRSSRAPPWRPGSCWTSTGRRPSEPAPPDGSTPPPTPTDATAWPGCSPACSPPRLRCSSRHRTPSTRCSTGSTTSPTRASWTGCPPCAAASTPSHRPAATGCCTPSPNASATAPT